MIDQSLPLTSLKDIHDGVYMTYKGKEDQNGTVQATNIIFVKNEKSKKEKNLWKKARLKEKGSKKANSFGSMKIGKQKFKVLPDENVQEYVTKLGASLIPKYQQELADDDENKIQFKFRVIHEKTLNAFATPTGTIAVHHETFDVIENEAQLAFILAHEIAHATQEHGLRQAEKDKKKRTGFFIASIASYAMGYRLIGDAFKLTLLAMKNGYQRSLENQSDRVALDTMVRLGYDPREGPATWKAAAKVNGDSKTNFFWSSHNSNAERRSYLMVVIRNTYPNIDFNNMKRDSEEFQEIRDYVNAKYPSKRRKKMEKDNA